MKRLLSLFYLLLLYINCSNSTSGNGSEITNGYCVANNEKLCGVKITAYPVNYNPFFGAQHLDTAISDDSGGFCIGLPNGIYNLHFCTGDSGLGAFLYSINSGSTLGKIELKKPGYIKGTIIKSDSYALIEGSPFYSIINENSFLISKVPSGIYNVTFLPLFPDSSAETGPEAPEGISVNSGDTIFIDFTQ